MTASLSAYSLISNRAKGHCSASATVSARKVLPTPGAPTNKKEAAGFRLDGSVIDNNFA